MNEQNPAITLLQDILSELKAVRTEITALGETLDAINQASTSVTEIVPGNGKAAAVPIQPNLPPAAQPLDTVQFDVDTIVKAINEDGQPTFRVRGPLYPRFGIKVWPEVLPKLGLDPDSLPVGQTPFNARVLALMGDKYPKKVVGLAPSPYHQQPQPAQSEDEYPF